MIQKSAVTGVIVGLLLTLATIYPAFSLFVLRALSEVSEISLIPLMLSAGAMPLVYLAVGSVAAWRAGANKFSGGLRAGAISGLVAGLTLYLTLVAPTAAILAGRDLLKSQIPPGQDHFPDALVVPFAQRVLMGGFDYLAATLLAGLVVGGVEGALVGWLRRNTPSSPRPSSLLEAIEDKHGRRAWFAACSDETLKIGLMAGIGAGVIWALADFWSTSTVVSSDPQRVWMSSIFRQALAGTHLGELLSTGLLALLGPLAILVALGAGGLAAFLPSNPPSRLGARVYAAMVAGAAAGVIIALPNVNGFLFSAAMLPQFVSLQSARGVELSDVERAIWLSLYPAPGRVMFMYLLPLPITAFFVAASTLWGALEGVFYGFILLFFNLRPVDRARMAQRDMLRRGDQFLPRLYRVFQTDRCAWQVLEHLAFNLKSDPAKSRAVAAYHTLATQPGRAVEALDVISQTLSQQPHWKLRIEIGALHSVIAQGLRAGTIAQMVAIPPIPKEQTSSLPPLLTKAGEHLALVLDELKKVERVDDLNSKIIFLNNTLESLRLAQIFCQEGATCGSKLPLGGLLPCATPFPEFSALCVLLDKWEAIVLSAIKEMQGRAELTATLKTRKLTFAPRLTLTVTLANRGLNVAENVRLRVSDSPECEVWQGQEQSVDILPPQGSRELSFTIKPHGAGRLRVNWQVVYDDALSRDRALEFGDLVEFVEAEKPFQHIFPIPYVTGTPLKSREMFVGRQDVFDFVREHLLGAYQNNVIVLHGQRRTGKTSILYRMNEVLADTHVCVLIDMQGKAARGEVEFLYSLADDIAYTLENKGITVALPPRQDFAESPEFFFRSRFLRAVRDALGEAQPPAGKNLLLMFDEFEELQKRVEDGKLTADIFSYLRNLMQHESGVDFIFAGTHKLEDLAAEYWSILFNIAAYKKITFLTTDEVTRLATEPVAPFGLEYDPLAVERIYQVAAGHPYLTQLICHELVTYHNETRQSYLTTTDLDAVLERIIEHGEAHFKYIWAESSTQRRLVLLALAELLETKDAATPDDVAELLRKRGRPLEGSALPQALNELEARDIVMRSDPRSSLYRFRVDLIRRWIYASRPAYEKVV